MFNRRELIDTAIRASPPSSSTGDIADSPINFYHLHEAAISNVDITAIE